MIGARIALIVGAGAALLAGTIGTLVGLTAAFARPWVDDTLSATLDVVIAFPVLLLAMLIVAVQGASLGSAILAIGLAMAAVIARLTRILARRVLQEQYVTAARTSGTRLPGIVGQHVLPNIAPTLAVNLALQFGVAVLAEASLSYLGLGAPPPNASWGRMLQEAQGTVSQPRSARSPPASRSSPSSSASTSSPTDCVSAPTRRGGGHDEPPRGVRADASAPARTPRRRGTCRSRSRPASASASSASPARASR